VSYLLLEGGRVIDGTGKGPAEGHSLVVKDGRIEKLVKGQVSLPSGAKRISVSGMTVMPGLIDSHLHLSHSDEPAQDPVRRAVSRFTAWPSTYALVAYVNAIKCLESGFTTVRDAGFQGDSIYALKDAISSGLLKGPRIQAGGGVTATMGHFDENWPVTLPRPNEKYIVDGADNIRKAVRERAREGANFIKTCTSDSWSSRRSRSWWRNYTLEELQALVDEAHAFDMPVSAHAYDADPSVKNAVLAGVDNIDHGLFLNDSVVKLMKERGTTMVPTLSVIKRIYLQGSKHAQAISNIDQRRKEVWEAHVKSTKMAFEAGVKVGAGTDAGTGYGLAGNNALELEILVEDIGLKPMEAIVAATKLNSEIMKMDKEIGTLEPGKMADLIVVDGDPLKDIRVLQDKARIQLVMIGGESLVDRMH
jgi:imidazolonepropionase-like amidohydrolase